MKPEDPNVQTQQTNPSTASITNNYYPQIEIERNSKPNRLYAIPLIGLFIKFILLIPIFIEVWLLIVVTVILVILINPFAVLFTGKYLKVAYDLTTGIMRLGAKTSLYLYGVTDKYPGFWISSTPFTWNLTYPESSNRLYAIPIIGFIIRTILIIPFAIFVQIISYASNLAVFFIITPLSVLIRGYYPETTHELAVDSIRLSNASMAYGFGLSDRYPSFKISWNHKAIKIVLIIIGTLLLLANFASNLMAPNKTSTYTPSFPIPSITLPPAQNPTY